METKVDIETLRHSASHIMAQTIEEGNGHSDEKTEEKEALKSIAQLGRL